MKKNILFFFSFFCSLVTTASPMNSVSIQQNSVETTISGNKAITTFQVYAPESHSYMIEFWLMGVKHTNNTYSAYDLRIDNGAVSDQVVTDCGDWNMYSPQNSSYVYLAEGTHIISLEGTLNDVPNALFVTGKYNNMNHYPNIGPTMAQCYQSLKNHVSLIGQMPGNPLESNYHKIDCFPYEHNSTSPPFYYTAELNKEVYYTFYRKEYYIANQVISYETDVIDGVDHVLNVFSPSDPENGSWSAASVNGHATLTVTIPQTGFYYVLIRTDSDDDWGTCNLTINNDRRFENIPVGCSRTEIVLPPGYGSFYSCFAKSLNGNPAILLIDDGDVVAYNDDFPYDATLSDYDWAKNARIDGPLSEDQWLLTITPTSRMAYKFDIYTGCHKPNYTLFPNLKLQDMIQSSKETYITEGVPDSINYNCISWAVGEWMVGYWLGRYINNTHSDIIYEDIVDSIFTSYGFTSLGADESNAIIDLWKDSVNAGGMACTHASVRSKGHQYAAGYAWESKLGHDIRIFHPRYAFTNGYGDVFAHYIKDDDGLSPGDPIIFNMLLSQDEVETIEQGVRRIRVEQKDQFESIYNKVKKNGKLKVSVSIDVYEEIEPYNQLLTLCREMQELHYLLYQKICMGEVLAIKLLTDITMSRDKQLITEVVEEVERLRLSMQTSKQKVISPIQTNAISLIKALLSKNKETNPKVYDNKYVSLSNIDLIETAVCERKLTIKFDLPTDAYVSVLVGSLDGSMINSVLNHKKLSAGQQQTSLNLFQPGIYTVGVIINGSVYKKKINVK